MAGLLVGVALRRRDPALQSGGHRLDLRVDGEIARLDRGPGRPLRRPFAGITKYRLYVSGAPRAGSPSHVSGAPQVRPVFA